MRLHFRASGLCALGLVLLTAPAFAADSAIYACVNKEGEVRLVNPTEQCRRHEVRVRWNVVGPQGPAGPQGPPGPVGPQGPQGAAGSQGPQGAAGAPGAAGQAGATGAQGPQGAVGPQGPKGDGFAYRGEYDPSQTYATNDVVVFGGSSFVATGPTVGAPNADASWTLIVEKGDPGQPGAPGATGPAGPQGVKGDKGDKGDTGDTGATGSPGANGGSVTLSDAPLITCPAGGVAITDAFQHTQFVCDGKTGAQGPQGATGSVIIVAETWVNTSSSALPTVACCSPANLAGSPASVPAPVPIVPNSSFTKTTGSGKLLIEATIPVVTSSGARLECQPNIDGVWAGSSLPGTASYDYVFQFSGSNVVNVTLSRVYPSPGAGTHTFTLACGSQSGTFWLLSGGVASFTVLELR